MGIYNADARVVQLEPDGHSSFVTLVKGPPPQSLNLQTFIHFAFVFTMALWDYYLYLTDKNTNSQAKRLAIYRKLGSGSAFLNLLFFSLNHW